HDEAAILLGQEARDPSVVGHRMELHFAASLAPMILEQPASGIEGVADRDIDVLMRMVCGRIAADGDLAAGNLEVNPDPEQIGPLMPRMAALDDDAARHDAIKEPFEFTGPLANARGNGFRGIHVPKVI